MSQRSLGQWLTYLEQLHPTTIDMGLARSRQVAALLGLGKPAKTVVTVTGTNGKGSTCAFLAELIRAQGLRVGVYSSPHLLRYNERVTVDGTQASDLELCAAFAAVEQARGEISLTYFEFGTLAAFWIFQQAALDVAVLEVGLGGRLDAVNLPDADLTLVTSIGLDHAEWLGDSRDTVAYEKAGIFRSGKPALCGDLNPPAILQARAAELQAPFLLRGRDFDLACEQDVWHWRGQNSAKNSLELHNLPVLDLPLENAALALQAYALLDLPWNPEQLAAALQRTRLRGRLERRSLLWQGKHLTLLLDVGHNPQATEYLAQRLQGRPIAGRRLAVFGLLADKDLPGVVAPLLGLVAQWAVTTLDTPRARAASELQSVLQQSGAAVSVQADIRSALQAQCECAVNGDEILVFGSFYCVAEALAWLAEGEVADGCAG